MNYLRPLQTWQLYFVIWHCFIKLVEANSHYEKLLIDSDICSTAVREIKIESDTAVNLTMSNLGNQYFVSYEDVKCHYRLQPASEYSGVIAIIQELSLRTEKRRCHDFVQFTTRDKQSKEICGRLNARHVMNSMSHGLNTQIDDVIFISDIGAMDVNIFISKELLTELPKINIIFTSFKYCYLESKEHKPCLKTKEICIHENFFLDGALNCPFYYCPDENGCAEVLIIRDSVGNKVLIASVTSLLLLFVIFILSLYICRKHRKLCWSEQFSNPNGTIQAQRTRVMEMEESPNQTQNVRPTAQVLSEPDKDLPPSYESLFPTR